MVSSASAPPFERRGLDLHLKTAILDKRWRYCG